MINFERISRWNAWRESYFDEVSRTMGVSKSKGAYRILGEFWFNVDAMPSGFALLTVLTTSNIERLHHSIRVKWDEVEPVRSAEAMLLKVREIQAHPMYVVSKRPACG